MVFETTAAVNGYPEKWSREAPSSIGEAVICCAARRKRCL